MQLIISFNLLYTLLEFKDEPMLYKLLKLPPSRYAQVFDSEFLLIEQIMRNS